MTLPLQALAAGAILAGFVGVPAALGGGNAIEHFLAPSFTVAGIHAPAETSPVAAVTSDAATDAHAEPGAGTAASSGVELGLMLFSVLVAAAGIGLAWRLYVTDPPASERLAARFAGAHRLLSRKYYVDEIYDSTFIAGTMASGRALWTFDRRVVDGFVNGSSWMTMFGSWLSGLTDRAVVDGLVNGIGNRLQRASYTMRRLQTGLVQNYAMLMLFGVFAFVSLYLFVR